MRLLIDEPNSLNCLGIRELDFCPTDWQSIRLSSSAWRTSVLVDDIRQWIYNNLSGRFSIIQDLDMVENKVTTVFKIGFEIPEEITMFNLACSHLHDTDVQVL